MPFPFAQRSAWTNECTHPPLRPWPSQPPAPGTSTSLHPQRSLPPNSPTHQTRILGSGTMGEMGGNGGKWGETGGCGKRGHSTLDVGCGGLCRDVLEGKWDKNGTKMGQKWDKNGRKTGEKKDKRPDLHIFPEVEALPHNSLCKSQLTALPDGKMGVLPLTDTHRRGGQCGWLGARLCVQRRTSTQGRPTAPLCGPPPQFSVGFVPPPSPSTALDGGTEGGQAQNGGQCGCLPRTHLEPRGAFSE